MTALRLIALVMILLAGDIAAVYGQTPSPLPPGMTQDQFDAMVDAISKAVVVKLKNEGALPTRAPAAAPSPAGVGSNVVADELAAFLEKTEHVLRAVPTLGAYLASIPRLLDEGKQGGRGALRFLLLLALVAGAGDLLAEPAIESIVIANAVPAFRVPTPVAAKRLVVLDVSEAIANAITEARDGA